MPPSSRVEAWLVLMILLRNNTRLICSGCNSGSLLRMAASPIWPFMTDPLLGHPDKPQVSIEESRRTEIGQLRALAPAHHLVGDGGTQKRRHCHPAMGDREVITADPRHRSDGGQMITGDRPNGDAHRL